MKGETFVFLVQQDPAGRSESAPLAEFYEDAFEIALMGWHENKAAWPPVRDLNVFIEWFEIVTTSTVVDLHDSMLDVDEIED